MSKAQDFITGLAARGQYHFTNAEMGKALGMSAAAVKMALLRLNKQRVVASPARGFYVIVPPEYRRLGCLPAEQFIPALMEQHGLPYYAALLSAAQFHGAAHHRPQEFQVALARSRRPITCGSVRVAFMARKRIAEVPVEFFNTPRGTIRVSTPEATALDLVGYEHQVGGLDQVATILAELAERIDPERLAQAARVAPTPWAQRLGYLLELVGAADKVGPLRDHVRADATVPTPLLHGSAYANAPQRKEWRLYLNADVEIET